MNIDDLSNALMNKPMSDFVNIRDHAGDTPLLVAVNKNHIDLVRALLNARADISIANNAGDTPISLVCASSTVNAAMLQLLSAHACCPLSTMMAKNNETILTKAVKARQLQTLTTLIEQGACVHHPNPFGETLLQVAACLSKSSATGTSTVQQQLRMVQQLLAAGAPGIVNSPNTEGKTVLRMAIDAQADVPS
jgi:ankyrin repeat protein